MLLTKIILQDYGVYRGKNEFDLACTADKPIILVGGTNGAGKTTLFESVMLCLYGISSMERRCTKKAYEQFLSKKIHRYAGSSTQADFASVTVQFRFFHAGRETEYRVKRMWGRTDDGLEERLLVHKRHADGEQFLPLDMVEESYWQSFIKDLIPKGVANMFFFDGEKVVEIAREGKEDFAIKESFKSLLGLDIIEQLRADLQVNLVRNLTKGGGRLQDDYEKYKAEKDEYSASNARLAERLAQKQNELDSLQAEIELLEARVSKLGGEFASGRESAKESLAAKRSEYAHLEKSIQENCSGYLPFSLVPERLEEVRSGMEEDQRVLQERLGARAVASELGRIKSRMESDGFWDGLNLGGEAIRNTRERVLRLLGEGTITPDKDRGEVFGFSSAQAARIFRAIDEAGHSAPDRLTQDTQALVVLGDEIQRLERTLASAASDDEIGQMVSELGRLSAQSGEVRTEINHMEGKVSSNAAMCTHINARLRDIVTQMYQDEKSKEKVRLTQNVQAVLDELLEKIKAGKLRLLEQYLLENTRLLMRKKQLIERIEIDPDTFGVCLFSADDALIPTDILSEGEKQMFVTAILWALAKTSGRPLPFMIDTPLARLDEGHRTNIVEKFLPLASHQAVVFSTDKEIEREYYEALGPYIARSYVMEFSEQDGSTRCREGYFWNEEGEKVAAV